MNDKITEPIEIDLQYEYRIKVEKPADFKKSLFQRAYLAAFNKLNDTIENRKKDDFDTYSNVICFTGERGRGKTSVMVSFKDSLTIQENKDQLKIYLEKKINFDKDKIINKKYVSLPVIDPTLFRGKETLLEIVLAQMFADFKEKLEKSDEKCSYDNISLKKEIILCFQNVFSHLKFLNSNRINNFDEDSLDALLNLASSTNLKASFRKLTQKYLEFLKNSDFLILALDDIDLKIEHNYLMLEDIRQILNNNQIIILTTFKYEQLFESINNHFKIQLSEIKISNLSEERTQLYLNKVFPLSRCIELDELNQLFEQSDGIRIINSNRKIIFEKFKNSISFEDPTSDLFKANQNSIIYEEAVREILWYNLRIILPKKENRVNAILPRTIREMIDFFKFSGDIYYDMINLSNYLNSLISDYNEKDILLRIKSAAKSNFKITFVNIINDLIDVKDLNNRSIDKEKLELLLNATNDSNISVGDIASLLFVLENSSLGKRNKLFIDVLEFYFYIQLKIKGIDFTSPEIYNGVVKLNTLENGWIIFNNFDGFNNASRVLMHYLGKFETKKKYREELTSPFFEIFHPNTRFAVFTPLSFFGNVVYTYFFENFLKIDDSLIKVFDKVLNGKKIGLIYDPIFLKQFLINYKAINSNIYSIKREILIEEESKFSNDFLKLYYKTFYENIDVFNLTGEELGIAVNLNNKDLLIDKLSINWFRDSLSGINSNAIFNDLNIIKERLVKVMNDGRISVNSNKGINQSTFNLLKQKLDVLVKQVEKKLIENNFDNGKLLSELKSLMEGYEHISDGDDFLEFAYNLLHIIERLEIQIDNE